MEALDLCTFQGTLLFYQLHAVHDYPGGSNAAIACHVSLAQITCCIYIKQTAFFC